MSTDTLTFVILAIVALGAVVWFVKSQQRRPYVPSIPSSRPTFMVDLSPEEKQRSAAQFIQSKLGEGEARRTIKDIAEACGLTVDAQMNAQAIVAPLRPAPSQPAPQQPQQQPPLPNP